MDDIVQESAVMMMVRSERIERKRESQGRREKERENEEEKSKLAKPHCRAVNRQTRERRARSNKLKDPTTKN